MQAPTENHRSHQRLQPSAASMQTFEPRQRITTGHPKSSKFSTKSQSSSGTNLGLHRISPPVPSRVPRLQPPNRRTLNQCKKIKQKQTRVSHRNRSLPSQMPSNNSPTSRSFPICHKPANSSPQVPSSLPNADPFQLPNHLHP
ncbi:hypothetical protein M758_UG186600 [Ceratodon purpureus]|nr:hypothetical protein M758_UG186600 [Ceratodon purpureus]